jgi:hypothetical protein
MCWHRSKKETPGPVVKPAYTKKANDAVKFRAVPRKTKDFNPEEEWRLDAAQKDVGAHRVKEPKESKMVWDVPKKEEEA